MLYFAKNIRYLRKGKRLTQEKAAVALGLTRTTYANYEAAGAEPGLQTLLKISSFFGVSIDDLLSKNIEMENLLGSNEMKAPAKASSKSEKTKKYELNDGVNSMFADRQETAIWYLLKEVKEIREDVDLLKKSMKAKVR